MAQEVNPNWIGNRTIHENGSSLTLGLPRELDVERGQKYDLYEAWDGDKSIYLKAIFCDVSGKMPAGEMWRAGMKVRRCGGENDTGLTIPSKIGDETEMYTEDTRPGLIAGYVGLELVSLKIIPQYRCNKKICEIFWGKR